MIEFKKLLIIAEVTIYIILTGISIWLLAGKTNFHIDEIFSYGLANYQGENIHMPSPPDGKIFENPEIPFHEYMTADVNSRFNYKQVWRNQKADVHPPLYYAILHTICSIFPESFSIFQAGCINILCIILIIYYVKKIMELINIFSFFQIPILVLFIYTKGIWSSICFLRMYAMAMLCVTITLYLFLKSIDQHHYGIYLKMFLVSTIGALTHYYYLIYLFFLCIIYGFFLFFNRKKNISIFLITLLFSGVSTITIFPPIIKQLFFEKRGSESFDNLKKLVWDDYINRGYIFMKDLNKQIFNEYGWLYLLSIFIMFMIFIYKERSSNKSYFVSRIDFWKWMLIVAPYVLYILLVTQIAVYLDIRYMMPVYSIIIISIYGIMFQLARYLFTKKLTVSLVLLISVTHILSTLDQTSCNFRKLPDYQQEKLSIYEGKDCIYIHNGDWQLQASYQEIRKYKSARYYTEEFFINKYQPKNIIKNSDDIIVIIGSGCNQENIIKRIVELHKYKNWKEVGSFGYSKTYYFW